MCIFHALVNIQKICRDLNLYDIPTVEYLLESLQMKDVYKINRNQGFGAKKSCVLFRSLFCFHCVSRSTTHSLLALLTAPLPTPLHAPRLILNLLLIRSAPRFPLHTKCVITPPRIFALLHRFAPLFLFAPPFLIFFYLT